MYPENNTNAFLERNKAGLFGSYRPVDMEYIAIVHSRLNICLTLLSNPELIQKFKLNYDEIFLETQKLLKILSYIEIPEPVPEKPRRNN